MIVVDASAAVLGLLDKGNARGRLSAERLAAPHLVDAEVLQTMRKLVVRGSLSNGAAERCVQRWTQLEVRRFPMVLLSARVWSLRNNLSAYDAC